MLFDVIDSLVFIWNRSSYEMFFRPPHLSAKTSLVTRVGLNPEQFSYQASGPHALQLSRLAALSNPDVTPAAWKTHSCSRITSRSHFPTNWTPDLCSHQHSCTFKPETSSIIHINELILLSVQDKQLFKATVRQECMFLFCRLTKLEGVLFKIWDFFLLVEDKKHYLHLNINK